MCYTLHAQETSSKVLHGVPFAEWVLVLVIRDIYLPVPKAHFILSFRFWKVHTLYSIYIL